MRYSLLSRFQGGLLGSLIGETLANRGEQPLSVWSKIGVRATESLILPRAAIDEMNVSPAVLRQGTVHKLETASSSEAALATLPVAIFFHESPSLLKEHIQQAIIPRQDFVQANHDVLIWGHAISLALRERLSRQLIPQLLNLNLDTPLTEQLEQVRFLLAQGFGLDQAVNHLTRKAQPSCSLALAFYCFSSTPEDFRLCVKRAIQSGYQPQLTSALTGALAGVYNGLGGIPPGWQRLHPMLKECDRQATRLFSAWSGVYEPECDFPPTAAVTSPLTIQKRSSLQLISQKE